SRWSVMVSPARYPRDEFRPKPLAQARSAQRRGNDDLPGAGPPNADGRGELIDDEQTTAGLGENARRPPQRARRRATVGSVTDQRDRDRFVGVDDHSHRVGRAGCRLHCVRRQFADDQLGPFTELGPQMARGEPLAHLGPSLSQRLGRPVRLTEGDERRIHRTRAHHAPTLRTIPDGGEVIPPPSCPGCIWREVGGNTLYRAACSAAWARFLTPSLL